MSSQAAARTRPAPLELVRAVPVWLWLGGLVLASAIVRYGFARRMVAPWIMIDEILYSELAKSLADTGRFLIREEPAGGALGLVYPLLISPAYLLFERVPDAYAAVKAINAVAISLAAVPAYLLARRVVQPGLALVAALLAVSVPSMLYAGTVMTENAFYPLFLLAALALVRALEHPTARRSLALLGAVALAFLTRAQAVVFLPAIVTAPLLLVLLERGGLRVLARFRALYASLAAALLLTLAGTAALGRPPVALLGAYRSVGEQHYELAEIARWLLYHVAELALYLGVVPFLALGLLAGVPSRLRPADRAFLAASLALSAWLLLQVAAFASRHSERIEERNMFYLAPLFFVALLVWIERGLPRARTGAVAVAALAALSPAAIPFGRLIGVSAQSDTLLLLAWWEVHEAGVALDRLWIVAALFASVLVAVALTVPVRSALDLPLVLLAAYAAVVQPIEAGNHGVRSASIGALFQGITRPERDWIDRRVGPDADVAAIWSGGGRVDRLVINENEFFNRSVGRLYHFGEEIPGGYAQTALQIDPEDGLLRDAGGRRVTARYALTDDSVALAGEEIARDERKGIALLALHGGPLRTGRLLRGLYDDLWAGRALDLRLFRCRAEALKVTLESDKRLFGRPQVVTARSGGRTAGRVRVAREGRTSFVVPLRPRAGRCDVRFTAARTAIPARVQPGSTDGRRLGVRFVGFALRP
ncbi:MAG: glycosyltransferase family 39 protein [Actinobacteria bacterium]|nr:glycosyltransferase family 39 protein [Actinomycetota bacterium]